MPLSLKKTLLIELKVEGGWIFLKSRRQWSAAINSKKQSHTERGIIASFIDSSSKRVNGVGSDLQDAKKAQSSDGRNRAKTADSNNRGLGRLPEESGRSVSDLPSSLHSFTKCLIHVIDQLVHRMLRGDPLS